MRIDERIIRMLDANGGSYAGIEQMSQDAPASVRGIRFAMRKCIKHNLVSIKRKGGGAGIRTVYRLTSKGLDYVRSK